MFCHFNSFILVWLPLSAGGAKGVEALHWSPAVKMLFTILQCIYESLAAAISDVIDILKLVMHCNCSQL